jgi:hypothetical protein
MGMVIGAVIGFCVLLFILAFLFPRLSRGPERGGQRVMGTGKHGASKAISKSASAGRRGRDKIS